MKQFYTQNGWAGAQYEETKKLPLKEIAKRIKVEVLAKYPAIKLSVSTEFFSGGCAVRCSIKDVPFKVYVKTTERGYSEYNYTEEAIALRDFIQKVGNQYRYDDSDGMIDYFNTNFYFTPDYSWEISKKEHPETVNG